MEELLESVADAVSALVMYSVEADDNNTAIPDILPGAQGVQQACEYLTQQAETQAENWVKINQEHMKIKMITTCAAIRKANEEIIEAATILREFPFKKEGKKILLKGAKGVMEHMVILLQYSDLYQVTTIIRLAIKVKSQTESVVSATTESDLKATAQIFVTGSADLARSVFKRIAAIDDFELQNKMEEGIENVKKNTNLLLQSAVGKMREPDDPQKIQELQIIKNLLDLDITGVVAAVRESAKSPFDLSQLEGLEIRDHQDIRDLHQSIGHQFNMVQRGLEENDSTAVESGLDSIKKSLNSELDIAKLLLQNTEDPLIKQKLENLLNEEDFELKTEQLLTKLSDQYQNYLLDPSPQNLGILDGLLRQAKEYSQQIVDATSSSSGSDVVKEAAKLENEIFSGLLEAIQRGDTQDALNKLKEAEDSLNSSMAIARTIASSIDDPNIRKSLQDQIAKSQDQIDKLMRKIREGIENGDSYDDIEKLVNLARKLAQQIATAASVETSENVYKSNLDLNKANEDLLNALETGDKSKANNALRAIRTALLDQIAATNALARKTDDPETKKLLENAANEAQYKLDDLLEKYNDLVEAALLNPGDQSIINQLKDVISECEAISCSLVSATAAELLKESNQILNQLSKDLAAAIKSGDKAKIIAALSAINNETKRQAELSQAIIDNTLDDDAKVDRIRTRMLELESLPAQLALKVKNYLENPNDENVSKDLLKSIQEVISVSDDLVITSTLDPEDQQVILAAKVDSRISDIKDLINRGDSEAIKAQLPALIKDFVAQVKLTNSLASSTKNSTKKKELLLASKLLTGLVSDMVGSVKDALNAPLSFSNLENILDQVQQSNSMTISNNENLEQNIADLGIDAIRRLDLITQNIENSNDPNITKTNLEEFQKSLAKQIVMATAMANSTQDPEKKDQILKSIKKLREVEKSLLEPLTNLSLDPTNLEAKKQFLKVVNNIKESIDTVIGSTIESPQQIVYENTLKLGQKLANLDNAVKNSDKQSVDQILNEINDQISKDMKFAKAVANSKSTQNLMNDQTNTNSATRKDQILTCLEKIENSTFPKLKDFSIKAANDHSLLNQYEKALDQFKKDITNLAIIPGQNEILSSSSAIQDSSKKIENQINKSINDLIYGSESEKKEAIISLEGTIPQELQMLKALNDQNQDPIKKRKIKQTINQLENILKDCLEKGKQLEKNPNDQKLCQEINDLGKEAIQVLQNIADSNNFSDSQNLNQNTVQIQQQLNNLEDLLQNGSNQEVKAALTNLKKATKKHTICSREIASNTTDKQQKNKILNSTKNIEDQFLPQLEDIVQDYLKNQNHDPKKYKDFSDSFKKELFELNGFGSDSNQAISQTIQKINNQLNNLSNTSNKDDIQKSKREANIIQQQIPIQIDLIKNSLLPNIKDENERQKIQQSLKNFENMIPSLISSATQFGDDTKDDQKLQKFTENCSSSRNEMAKILSQTKQDLEQSVLMSSNHLQNELDEIQNIDSQNSQEKFNDSADVISNLLTNQILETKALSLDQNLDQNTKQNLEKNLENLISKEKEFSNAKRNNDFEKIKIISKEIKQENESLISQVNIVEKQKKEAKEEKIRKEKEAKEEERLNAIKLKEELEKLKQDEISQEAAILNAKAEQAQKKQQQNSEPQDEATTQLFTNAQKIAQQMAILAEAAKTGSKKDIITSAREIAALAADVVKQAREISKKCSDPVLLKQLATASNACKNFSVQLKILSAVKAASDYEDPTSKKQLVVCARGLAKSVADCIDAAEIAKIRT